MCLYFLSFLDNETAREPDILSHWKQGPAFSYVVNAMAAGYLATPGARTSTAL